MQIDTVQRRTLRLLFVTQIISGVGVAVGSSVGALLAADLAGVGVSGLAQSAAVIGAALCALPATAIVHRFGRRPSLATLYIVGAAGGAVVLTAATRGSIPLLFLGFFLFGGASAANYQARYAAVDLAPIALRGRHLSLVIWATTLGAAAGPNLAPVAGRLVGPYGVPTLAGPYLVSAVLLALASLLLLFLLRPDPAVVARLAGESSSAPGSAVFRRGVPAAFRFVLSHSSARLGVCAVAVGNLIMVAVMAMTPVHIRNAGHDAEHTLGIVVIVLSCHVAGMYAFAPVMGWLTDRFGRRPVIFLGVALLLVACGLAGTAGYDTGRLAAGLMVLGLGWSATIVAGSTLLNDSIPVDLRASAQGLSDLVMGLAGASAGALSGLVVELWSYPRLTLLAALTTLPLIGLLAVRGRTYVSGEETA